MKTYKVKDLMVPLSEYAMVPKDASLYDAVLALEKAQEDFDHTRYRHRAILIADESGNVIGKMSQLDVLRALEPKYGELQDRHGLARFGFTKKFMKSMLNHYHLWDGALEDICKKAANAPVSQYMYTPSEGEYVDEEAGLDEAIHQLVLGHHQSLLVTQSGSITGVLRLTDVFAAIFHSMKACFIE
ncbi:MAG: CBS domain-containing protein [Desulfobacteraceae bacterium]|nr:CBS domain-containing protein [Desulfobacteraceae bacterium]